MTRTFNTLIALLSFGVAAYAIFAYAALPIGAVLHPDIRITFAAHSVLVVYLHVFGAALALLLGPFQFRAHLRERRPGLHRWIGRLYLAVGVGVGGVTGLALAVDAYGGFWSRSGFAALALVWMGTGVMALSCIRRGDVAAHRRWMMRNYSLTFAAVMLRLYLPLAIVGGVELALAYALVAWLCWAPNLLLVEWLMRRRAVHGAHKDRAGFAVAWRT